MLSDDLNDGLRRGPYVFPSLAQSLVHSQIFGVRQVAAYVSEGLTPVVTEAEEL